MSAKWTFWAWDQEIKTAPKKLALLQLANNANDDGKSWYSIEKMAKACGVSDRTFQRQIQSLEEDGLLHVERRNNRPSIYTLTNEVEITLQAKQGCQSVTSGCQSVTLGGVTESHDPNSNPNNEPNTSLTPAKPQRSKFKYSSEDMTCAEWIRQRVEMVNPAAPKANLESWANTIRLMREMDKKSHREILEVFKWANLDSFWCNNIQSPEKLRKQFGNLKGRMSNAANQPAANATGNRRLTAEEERNQELLRKYGHTTAPTERTINTDEHSGLDQRQIQRGIPEQVEQEGVTIDLDSGDWSSYGQSDSQGC